MRTDVIDLRDFYETNLGQMVRRMIMRRIRLFWPDLRGLRLVGLGYASPYLVPFQGETERTLCFMPAPQGVLHWPPHSPNLCVLTDEDSLPLQDASIDRLLLVHALECSEQIRPLLAECWRVLAGGGRLLVVVPNRRGLWARFDHTPFGAGHPYTPNQLRRLMRDCAFTPVQSASALFIPPTRSGMVLSAAGAWERIGSRWFPSFSGVVLIEASKQIYAKPRLERRMAQLLYQPIPRPVLRRDPYP